MIIWAKALAVQYTKLVWSYRSLTCPQWWWWWGRISSWQWRQKYLMVMEDVLGNTPRGRWWCSPQQVFPLVMKPRFNRPVGDKSGTKVEVETCTTQPNYFAPTRQWGCQSHWPCWKRRITCIEWKEMIAVKKTENNRLYSNNKRKDRGPQFTRGVSPQDNKMLGKQITSGNWQLRRHTNMQIHGKMNNMRLAGHYNKDHGPSSNCICD